MNEVNNPHDLLKHYGWNKGKTNDNGYTFYSHNSPKLSRTHDMRVSPDGKAIKHTEYNGWTGFAYTGSKHADITPDQLPSYLKKLHKDKE
jgi:hypothetical protein